MTIIPPVLAETQSLLCRLAPMSPSRAADTAILTPLEEVVNSDPFPFLPFRHAGAGRASSGSLRYPTPPDTPPPMPSPMGSLGSADSRNAVNPTASSIGRSSLQWLQKPVWLSSDDFFQAPMRNSPSPPPPMTTSGKKTLGLRGRNLSSGSNQSAVTPSPIGNQFGLPPKQGILWQSQRRYAWCLIGNS